MIEKLTSVNGCITSLSLKLSILIVSFTNIEDIDVYGEVPPPHIHYNYFFVDSGLFGLNFDDFFEFVVLVVKDVMFFEDLQYIIDAILLAGREVPFHLLEIFCFVLALDYFILSFIVI